MLSEEFEIAIEGVAASSLGFERLELAARHLQQGSILVDHRLLRLETWQSMCAFAASQSHLRSRIYPHHGLMKAWEQLS